MCDNTFENMRSWDIQIPKCEWPQGYQMAKGKGVGQVLGQKDGTKVKGKGVGWGGSLGQEGGARAWVRGALAKT